jgi:hypothetical protein
MSFRHVAVLICTAFCLILCVATSAFAQSERGTISGTVTDSTGAVIPAAKVSVTNLSTNSSFTSVTTDAGDYAAPSLSPGQYNVRIDKDGFKPTVLANVTVNASTNTRADVTLEVGSALQAIESKLLPSACRPRMPKRPPRSRTNSSTSCRW